MSGQLGTFRMKLYSVDLSHVKHPLGEMVPIGSQIVAFPQLLVKPP